MFFFFFINGDFCIVLFSFLLSHLIESIRELHWSGIAPIISTLSSAQMQRLALKFSLFLGASCSSLSDNRQSAVCCEKTFSEERPYTKATGVMNSVRCYQKYLLQSFIRKYFFIILMFLFSSLFFSMKYTLVNVGNFISNLTCLFLK